MGRHLGDVKLRETTVQRIKCSSNLNTHGGDDIISLGLTVDCEDLTITVPSPSLITRASLDTSTGLYRNQKVLQQMFRCNVRKATLLFDRGRELVDFNCELL